MFGGRKLRHFLKKFAVKQPLKCMNVTDSNDKGIDLGFWSQFYGFKDFWHNYDCVQVIEYGEFAKEV